MPVAIRLGLLNVVGVTRDCTSINSGRVPSIVATIVDPGTFVERSSKTFLKDFVPFQTTLFHFKIPISFVEPKRFLTALRIR